MASSLSSFKVEHASGLHAVARKLDELHRASIRADGDEDGAPTVRLSVLNLVAACTSVEDADVASQTVGVLSQSHPCRAIVVYADPNGPDSIEADLSFQRGADDASSEQVRLNVHGRAALHLASVITPLLVPDIPVYLWLVGSPPIDQAFGDDAMAIAERIVLDSGEYDVRHGILPSIDSHARDESGLSLTDIAWNRTRIWREMISQAFDGPEMQPFVRKITRVEIESVGAIASTQAWLCAGWLAQQLGWRNPGGPYLRVSASRSDGVPDNDLCAVRLSCVGKDHNATIDVQRANDRLNLRIDVDGGITASQSVVVQDADIAHMVAGLLEDGMDDYHIYVGALHQATQLAPSR